MPVSHDSCQECPDWLLYSRFALRPMAIAAGGAADIVQSGYTDRVLAVIAPEVDPAFYRAAGGLPDGEDAVRHYARTGWQDGRNPNNWFDTTWYLSAYPDIRLAGMNPLFHYLAFGQREGRLPRRPGGPLRGVLERATVPAERRPGYDAPADAVTLDAISLGHHLVAATVAARGLVVAVSHDCYIHITGGMQVLIADEQALFNADRITYLHLSPAVARLTLEPEESPPALLQVVLDGRSLGLAPLATVETMLQAGASALPRLRLFVVHSVFGHRASSLARLAGMLNPAHSFFWLHDFSALCEGFNLMRNDVAFCHAPPADSAGCRICVYGTTRPAYLAALHGLFSAVAFHVLAPGRAALDLFLRSSDLPCRSARVHENLVMAPQPARAAPLTEPLRVAFVGFPMAQKGWPAFQELLRQGTGLAAYRFHHFAAPAVLAPTPGLVGVAAQVGPGDRFAMVRALSDAGIDLVLVLSPWPETFSYVTHEAFAAGADVVALADSGNVADAVRRHRRGVVLADAAALLRFFRDGYALDYARQRAAAGIARARLHLTGTTATVDLASIAPIAWDSGLTDEPDLVAVAPSGTLTARRQAAAWHFALPVRAGCVRLVSRRAVTNDRAAPRGVAVAALLLDGQAVPLDDERLGHGWLPVGSGVRWTHGDAVVEVGQARLLEVRLAPGAQYRRLAFAVA